MWVTAIVEPDLPCWTCKMCTTGRENLCENLQFFGCGYAQGGMADYFTVAANRLHPVPDVLDDHAAALIEPLSTPVHAVRRAGRWPAPITCLVRPRPSAGWAVASRAAS